jgi:glycosyltransferase involved in cell wall biosynthesis
MRSEIAVKSSVLISVLTPTWNRSSYLHKVWEGLQLQTFRDFEFEWVVANDGSNDGTIEVVKELAKKSNFQIRLISASLRVGKARMDNEAVRIASGEFILWCDSDDWLLPNALETLILTWRSIPEAERDLFAGVTALCASKAGVLDNIFPNAPFIDLKWNNLLAKMKYDMVLFCRADLLKETPFLEVDYVVPETSVWNVVGVKKTRFIPIALKFINYGSGNCISWSGAMAYNRGRAYALARTKMFFSETSPGVKVRAWRFINYFRYCFHGEIPLRTAISMWGGGVKTLAAAFPALPIAALLAMKDYVQGRVRKTHRDFLIASRDVVISIESFNVDGLLR